VKERERRKRKIEKTQINYFSFRPRQQLLLLSPLSDVFEKEEKARAIKEIFSL
jgi:hypothetical protein